MNANNHTKEEEVLLLDVRKKIYLIINRFPASHFRELQRRIGIATGNLEHHLNYLEKTNLIKIEKLVEKRRLYPLGLNDYERKILGILRQKNFRKIILKHLDDGFLNHRDIANYLQISPSSTTWYLNRLIDNNILVVSTNGRKKIYQLKDKHELIKVLIAYKKSFLDVLVDKFVDTWED